MSSSSRLLKKLEQRKSSRSWRWTALLRKANDIYQGYNKSNPIDCNRSQSSNAIKVELDLLESSLSWRITAPFRRLWDITFFEAPCKGFWEILSKKSLGINEIPKLVLGFRSHGSAFGLDNAGIYNPLVSIIVPNYNHKQFLEQRLESIYSQTYQNIEVILLDDASTDGSREILDQYFRRNAEKTKVIYNKTNSGGVFRQWKKGLEEARGDLIWIAESDDYADQDFLSILVQRLANPLIALAFAPSVFVNEEEDEVWSTKSYLSDISEDPYNWEGEFTATAYRIVRDLWCLKNIVPNVSSCIFRKPVSSRLLNDENWLSLRMTGDWMFYLEMIKGGCVSYTSKTKNYYRQHSNNTSVATAKTKLYFKEYEIAGTYLLNNYPVDSGKLKQREEIIYAEWKAIFGESSADDFRSIYDTRRIMAESAKRKPWVLMCAYSLAAGGGETFPINLANTLKKNGYSITFANFNLDRTESGVRAMLSSDTPLLEINPREFSMDVIADLGIEIVHTHHASIDKYIAEIMATNQTAKHLVSLHGMYEMMKLGDVMGSLDILSFRTDRFVYTTKKNLRQFSTIFQEEKGFIRIDNALPDYPIHPISWSEMGIPQDAFVLCLVSRALPEKGWQEAIDAVIRANNNSACPIYLILIGEGPEYTRLKEGYSDSKIIFLGFKKNIRDYFAASDMGFLPSRYPGESFPLVIIDCLKSGTPVLASNLGEIRNMLTLERKVAGHVFDLKEMKIDVAELASIIQQVANDRNVYNQMKANVALIAERFNMDAMCSKYDALYCDMNKK